MKNGSFLKITIGLFLAMLIVFASFTYAIDPLFQYHQPWFGLLPSVSNERYQNPGIAKTFDYNTVIMGNSMSQNLRCSWVDKVFGGKTVKLTMAGAYWSDYEVILNILADREKQPERIIWNLSITPLPLDAFRVPLPLYLYDSTLLNDVNYLLNKDIFFDFTYKTLFLNKSNNVPNYDDAYVWDTRYSFSRSIALKAFGERESINPKKLPLNAYYNHTIAYIERMEYYFQRMPNTHFYIWIPPYSMLYWDNKIRSGEAEALLAYQNFTLEELLKSENISLFMFSDRSYQETISNLDNYKDATHFSTIINKRILESIACGAHQVTSSNLKEKMKEFSDFILQFNYERLFEE